MNKTNICENFKNENLLKLFSGYNGHKLNDRLDWREISRYQKLSSEFIESHRNYFPRQ